MSTKKHFFISTFLVAFSSFLSRVLGLLRSTLLSTKFGATSGEGLTDCYSAAFRLPDIIFNVVVFGTISIVFIPYFSGLIKDNDKDKLNRAVNGFLNFFVLVVAFVLFIGFIFAELLVRNFLVKGWSNEVNIMLTVRMTRILFFQVFFMTLSSIFGAFLNAIERFFAYSFAILSYNIGIIAGILFLTPFFGIEGVAWGAVLGSFLHFFIQFSGSFANGYRYRFGLPKFDREVGELFVVAFPRIIATSGEQFAKFFIVNFASFLFVGSIFIFENAENFAMVPFGTIAVSISTTTFPVFSKLYALNEFDKLYDYLFEKLRLLLFLMLPVIFFMMLFGREIVELLLTYKKYTDKDATLTASALWFYLIGMPFFSLTIVLVKFYYAQKSSLLPMIVTIISIAFTIYLSAVLSKQFDVRGLSISRAGGYAVQAILLISLLPVLSRKNKKPLIINLKPLIDIAKIIVINLLLLILSSLVVMHINFFDNVKLNALFKIGFFFVLLSILYFLFCYIFKIPEAIGLKEEIKKTVKKFNVL